MRVHATGRERQTDDKHLVRPHPQGEETAAAAAAADATAADATAAYATTAADATAAYATVADATTTAASGGGGGGDGLGVGSEGGLGRQGAGGECCVQHPVRVRRCPFLVDYLVRT